MIYNLTEGKLNAPVDVDVLKNLSGDLEYNLPNDYLDFLREHDGGEGFIGENYVIFWKATEIASFNREYEVGKYAPGILLFGSDGGGEGYGFDTRDAVAMPIVRVPFIGMELRYVTFVAENISDFFEKLAK